MTVISLLGWQRATGTSASRFEYGFLYVTGTASQVGEGDQRAYDVDLAICYAEPGGCRWENVTQRVPWTEFPSARGYNMVTGKALAKLGNDGWELVGSGKQSSGESGSTEEVLYFKRAAGAR